MARRRFARQVPVAGLPRAAETDRVVGIDEKGPHRVIGHRDKLFFAPEGQGLDHPFAGEPKAVLPRLRAVELDEVEPAELCDLQNLGGSQIHEDPHRADGRWQRPR